MIFETKVEDLNAVPYINEAVSDCEAQPVTYSVKTGYKDIADVNADTGAVTFKAQGTVVIVATMPASPNYKESTAEYTITTKQKRESFEFATTEPSARTFEPNLTYSNEAVAQPANGDIEYEIIEQKRDGEVIDLSLPDVEPVAEIDQNGKVTVLTAGEIIVQATIEDTVYESKKAEYVLKIEKASQHEFAFTQSAADLVYGEDFTFVAKGGAGTGAVTYEITAGTDFVKVDSDTGLVEAIKADGAVKITATKAADNCYAGATANATFITSKAEQPAFKFVDATPDTVDYGTTSLVVKAEGGQAGGIITYSIEGNSEIASIDSTTGEITFKDGAEGTFTVKAVKSGVDNYLDIETTHDITVVVNDYSAEYEISAPDGNDDWYKNDIVIRPKEGYLISTSNVIHETEGQWTESLSLPTEGITTDYTFYLKKKDDSTIGKAIVIPELKLDKSLPSVAITYSQEKTLLEKIQGVFDRFYDEKMTVNLALSDDYSGISYVVYYLDDGTNGVTIDQIENNAASFDIDPMYKGCVKVDVYDVAGNKLSVTEVGKNTIIVDNEKPVISVSYDNDNAANDSYYKAERTASIQIKETNFYAEDVKVYEFKRLDNEFEYTQTQITPAFTKVEGTDNTYEMKIPFTDDADYQLKVEYEDKSGNEAVPYDSGEFTVDKTLPVISYSGMDEGVYYSTDKELTLTIDEHNFDPAFVEFDIAATDKEDKAVDLSAKGYETYLQKADSWIKDGNKYTAKILIDAEGTYSITTNYTDLAGNAAEGKSLGFIMDKTNPAIAVSYDNNDVANGTKFKAERKATISIDEHNFDASKVDVTVTAKDKSEKDVSVPNYAEHVKKVENWTTSGNVHSIVLTFDVEADYTFAVSCTDLSGRTDDGV
ncbi:MAG: hypothetical protein IKI99_00140, partial [Firmicutes bacterium]|nr:hypothetical protein [Bacillota bacterium]